MNQNLTILLNQKITDDQNGRREMEGTNNDKKKSVSAPNSEHI